MKIYLVGGAVRDMCLGRTPKDRDYLVVGATADEHAAFLAKGYKPVGKSFSILLQPETNAEFVFADSLEADLARRDLTVNAMAVEVNHVTFEPLVGADVIDNHGGLRDLEIRVLRHIDPDMYASDPIRVLRTARLACRYDFDVHMTTLALHQTMQRRGDLDNLCPERVQAEIKKAFTEKESWRFLFTLGVDALNAIFHLQWAYPEFHRRMERLRFEQTIITDVDVLLASLFYDCDEGALRKLRFSAEMLHICHAVNVALTANIGQYDSLNVHDKVALLVKLGVTQKSNVLYKKMFTVLYLMQVDILRPMWDAEILRHIPVGDVLRDEKYSKVNPAAAKTQIFEAALSDKD